jgi:hypothetical protein
MADVLRNGSLVLDVSSAGSVRACVDLLLSRSNRLDANNAGSRTVAACSTIPGLTSLPCATLDLFQTGADLMRQNLRRRYPDAHEHEIDRLLREWLLDRPGAEAGDCPGRPIDVKSRFA